MKGRDNKVARTRYYIKGIKYGNYFQKNIFKHQKHFVADIDEARPFPSRKIANQTLEKFNNKEKFEIVGIKRDK